MPGLALLQPCLVSLGFGAGSGPLVQGACTSCSAQGGGWGEEGGGG